jgi:peptidyl-prolyl cis-trans isomerase D
MLEAMKRGAQTWVAKILFALLVFSFAIWGISDVFTGGGRGAVATVGSTQITAEEVQRAFQNELDQFSSTASQRLSAEQGRALGLDRRVVTQLIGGAAIESHAERMGLALSDQTLVEGVQADPNFHGPDGRFSQEGFQFLLRQLGVSEQGFLNLRRRDELRNHVIGAFVRGQSVPEPLIDLLHKHNEEKRKIEWITIDAQEAVSVADPDEAKLKSLYEADSSKYMTPEYRHFEVLLLTLDDMKKSVEVAEDEIKASYEATKESYNTPERRRIQQIAFPSREAAEAAAKALADGSKTFADVATEAGAKDTDVDLGLIAKKAMIDPKIADAAFALEQGKFSDVVDGRFATVILRVTQIEPAIEQSFEVVKQEVRDKLAADRARVELPLKFDEIEDLRLAGKTLKEIADALKVTFRDIPAADRRGLNPDNKPALENAELPTIVARVFQPEAAGDEEPVPLANGGHAWINRLGVTAPKQLPFDEVKDEIKDTYLSTERSRLVGELARKLVDELNGGADKAAIEAQAKSTFATTEAVTRVTVPQGLSESSVAQAFTLPVNRAASAQSSNRASETVFRVVEIVPAPEITKEQRDKLVNDLTPALANQVLTEYTDALKLKLGTSINDTELRRAIGVTTE